MAAIVPTFLASLPRGGVLLESGNVAALDFLDLEAAGYNPGEYEVMRVTIKSGGTADKIRFAAKPGTANSVILESAGYCICPDAANETGYLLKPSRFDTVVNLAAGATAVLYVELLK